jgi:hypothetical protein
MRSILMGAKNLTEQNTTKGVSSTVVFVAQSTVKRRSILVIYIQNLLKHCY